MASPVCDLATVNPILEVMHDSVLPKLEKGVGHVLPGEGKRTKRANISDFREIARFGMHQHENYEWVWVLQGNSHIQIDGVIHPLLAGDFCLLPPRTMHAEVYTPFARPYRSIWCSYDADALSCRISSFAPNGQTSPEARRAVQAPSSRAVILAVLEKEMRSAEPYSSQVCDSLLISLAHLMMRALESPLSADDIESLPGSEARRVLNYLNHHYADPVSLDEVGHAVGMSRNHLCSTFKKETGKTIGAALTEIRLGHAKTLLLEGRHSVQEVARAVGYASPEHFCRIFQRHERTAPSSYGK